MKSRSSWTIPEHPNGPFRSKQFTLANRGQGNRTEKEKILGEKGTKGPKEFKQFLLKVKLGFNRENRH